MTEQNEYIANARRCWLVVAMLVVASVSFLHDRANGQSRYDLEVQCYKLCETKFDNCQKLNKSYSPKAFNLCDKNSHSCVNNCKKLYVPGLGGR